MRSACTSSTLVAPSPCGLQHLWGQATHSASTLAAPMTSTLTATRLHRGTGQSMVVEAMASAARLATAEAQVRLAVTLAVRHLLTPSLRSLWTRTTTSTGGTLALWMATLCHSRLSSPAVDRSLQTSTALSSLCRIAPRRTLSTSGRGTCFFRNPLLVTTWGATPLVPS